MRLGNPGLHVSWTAYRPAHGPSRGTTMVAHDPLVGRYGDFVVSCSRLYDRLERLDVYVRTDCF